MSYFHRVVAGAVAALLTPLLSEAKHETWVEIRSPNFIVVSNAGEKQALKAALQLEEIRAVFRQSIKIAASHPTPVITVLAVKDEASMRELLPEYWTKGHSHPAGLFAGRFNQLWAAVDLDAQGSNPYETFYHEYFHTIAVPYFPDLPVWLSEGLAEFYGHTEIEEKYVGMGRVDPVLLEELRTNSLIPLSVLFQVNQSSPYYNEANKTSIFYAESWALTHYLMMGDRRAHSALLGSYLDALDHGQGQEKAAAVAFGDLKKLQSDLQSYIGKALFLYMRMPPAAAIPDDQLKLRPLSEAESDAYRGGFAVVRGQSEEAVAILDESLRLDPNTALVPQYLAMAEFMAGQREKALDSLSKAITLDSKNSFTRFFRAFVTTSGPGIVSRDPQIEDDLRQSIALAPEFAPSYSLLAIYLAARGENLEDALAFAQKAVSLEPGNSNAQLSLAQVFARMDKYDEANLAVARASAWATDPASKANAESYKTFLVQKRQYESRMTQVSGDRPVLRTRAGADAAPTSESDRPDAPFAVSMRLEMEIATIGGYSIDLKPYLQSLAEALRHKLASRADITLPQERVVALEFAVMNDGTTSGLKVAASSGDTKLDQAAQDGITASGPLPTPPKELKGRPVRLRLQLSYIPGSAGSH